MTVSDLRNVMDFFLDCVLNVWNTIRTYGGILFIILVVLCLYPVLRRIFRSIRGNK